MITPNLQGLVDNGITLENHYVQPTCRPTRAALLTGHYPIHTGRQHNNLRAQEPKGPQLVHRSDACWAPKWIPNQPEVNTN